MHIEGHWLYFSNIIELGKGLYTDYKPNHQCWITHLKYVLNYCKADAVLKCDNYLKLVVIHKCEIKCNCVSVSNDYVLTPNFHCCLAKTSESSVSVCVELWSVFWKTHKSIISSKQN